jgi:hypothetical protein
MRDIMTEIKLEKNQNINKDAFIDYVFLAEETRGISPIEAILEYCERYSVDTDTIVPFVKSNQKLKNALMQNASKLNLLKKK